MPPWPSPHAPICFRTHHWVLLATESVMCWYHVIFYSKSWYLLMLSLLGFCFSLFCFKISLVVIGPSHFCTNSRIRLVFLKKQMLELWLGLYWIYINTCDFIFHPQIYILCSINLYHTVSKNAMNTCIPFIFLS